MTTYSECKDCFYVPGETHIIDVATEGVSFIEKETLDQIQQRYPGAVYMPFDEAFEELTRISYEKYISPPAQITEEYFHEMLDVLPPMKWRREQGSESFMICEALTLDIRSIYCRIGDQYFEMADRQSLTHEQIVEKCSLSTTLA